MDLGVVELACAVDDVDGVYGEHDGDECLYDDDWGECDCCDERGLSGRAGYGDGDGEWVPDRGSCGWWCDGGGDWGGGGGVCGCDYCALRVG
jgi:hypothetical protein